MFYSLYIVAIASIGYFALNKAITDITINLAGL